MEPTRIPLIMTRPTGSNERFIDNMPQELRSKIAIVISPLIDIVPNNAPLGIGPKDCAIFTSANGVRFAPPGQGRDAYCVGEITTQAAAEMGWNSRYLGATSAELVSALTHERKDVKFWHLSGVHTRGEIVKTLEQEGLDATRSVIYDQKLLDLNQEACSILTAQKPVIVPIFSPRTAEQFTTACPQDASPYLLALSQAVAKPLEKLSRTSIEIVTSPTARAMMSGIEELVTRIRLG